MKKLYPLVMLSLIVFIPLLGQEQDTDEEQDYELYILNGLAFNEKAKVNGPITVELAVYPDSTVTGYLDADSFPGFWQGRFCGAGEFEGELNGNRLWFSFISMDPDPECGYDFGNRVEFDCTFNADFSIMTGDFQIFRQTTLLSRGRVHIIAENQLEQKQGPTTN